MKLINVLLIASCIFVIDTNFTVANSTNAQKIQESFELDKALYWASFDGDYNKVKVLIEQGANVNFSLPNVGIVQSDGLTPLHRAVGLGNEAKLNLLKLPDQALVKKRLKVVELLINKGANVNARSFLGKTPLHVVKIKEVAELLISHGADVNAQDFTAERLTPLQNLYGLGLNENVGTVLISHGADLNYKTTSGTTALVLATRTKNKELVELLVSHGADINASTKGKNSALENAIYANDDKIIVYLISKGAYLTTESLLGFSEMHWAVNNNNIQLVKKILANGYAIDYADKVGHTALFLAVFNNNNEIAKLLINDGADVNVISPKLDGKPLFFFAKDEQMIRLLLKSGININAVDSKGNNYLYYIKDKNLVRSIEGRLKLN